LFQLLQILFIGFNRIRFSIAENWIGSIFLFFCSVHRHSADGWDCPSFGVFQVQRAFNFDWRRKRTFGCWWSLLAEFWSFDSNSIFWARRSGLHPTDGWDYRFLLFHLLQFPFIGFNRIRFVITENWTFCIFQFFSYVDRHSADDWDYQSFLFPSLLLLFIGSLWIRFIIAENWIGSIFQLFSYADHHSADGWDYRFFLFWFLLLLSSVSFESGSLLRQIEWEAFSFTQLRSVCLSVDVQSIAWDAFPRDCEISRVWSIFVHGLALIGLKKQEKKERREKWETKKGKRRTDKEENWTERTKAERAGTQESEWLPHTAGKIDEFGRSGFCAPLREWSAPHNHISTPYSVILSTPFKIFD
jgi:hypothetical protein